MTGQGSIIRAIESYARATGAPLSPQWSAELGDYELAEDADALAGLCGVLGWPYPTRVEDRPRPDQFPLLVYDANSGWSVVRQWDSADAMLLAGERGLLPYAEDQRFYRLRLPDPLSGGGEKAIDVFKRAIGRRRGALVMAGLATVFANILTLATSLYSMQLYDRVIPLASFDTLWVLTAGVIFALTLDLVLRALRAVLIEKEANQIDAEVSEYFFARAQAIRLDARPPGIGTLAAQLRGQEQIRQVMSSGSLFLLADLPFAIFFIVVISWIGGWLAIVPIASLPIAVIMALILSRVIRTGADRAQVSGNRKNGMLVESLDAAEMVKANRGTWFMMGRWNALIREIHHYEDPVKKASAVSGTLFSTLQQLAYIVIMGWGAYLAANNQITTGALLACSIIAGRINGPLVAQLPNLIIQWSYARSSLRALDGILQLPLDPATSSGALRPDHLSGPFVLSDVSFTYAGGRQALQIDRLAIAPGERIAIVGGIGSGKSTLLKLLTGLYAPQTGTALIGGLDLNQIADSVVRRHIGYLPQDARMINGTLRDNLTMGLGEVGDAAIMDKAKATRLEVMIASHPQGLAMQIQEGGRGLSGGQRSLVGINRLLHAAPSVWLLDEPSAALDQLTETAALDAIDRQMASDDILVMVTHKLQLLSRFNRIIVMREGRIVRDGKAQDIIAELAGPRRPGAPGQGQGRPRPVAPPEGGVTTTIKRPPAPPAPADEETAS
ncbi:ATP-binding cassette domain-containing protein [Croceibacterium sp. TMG7-5b_MA50]|uniref:ATP-binding cassette domain-containing protein n=1 Tax=Croceibacterium sp. TMG7-5b_MA50 TaxID=3121290 RepID=UPI003221D922